MGLPYQNDTTPLLSALNVVAATVVKPNGGYLYSMIAGAAGCSLYDSAALTGNIAANLIVTVAASSVVNFTAFPFKSGLLIVGAGPTAVAYQ